RYNFPFLHPIPNEIQAVPLNNQIFLSPIFMHYSLERNLGHSAIYTKYKTLTGTMNFSKNMRSLILFSGMIGTYLENNSNNSNTGLIIL
ncbi:9634_t:CDS:1, partial [Funneliformis geosporum]